MRGGKRLQFCMTNLLKTIRTKFLSEGFVEEITKTFWCVFFSVHSV